MANSVVKSKYNTNGNKWQELNSPVASVLDDCAAIRATVDKQEEEYDKKTKVQTSEVLLPEVY